MIRIRHSAAAVVYGFAWLSMVALVGTLAIADLLQGEASVGIGSRHADAVAHFHIVRRSRR